MFSRFGIAITVGLAISMGSAVSAQVVRFETTVGNFDMVLNPTNNPILQAHVDNMLDYVESNRYRASWINRAAEGFVLQMGGFYSHTRRPPPTIDSTREVRSFDPVPGEPAAENSGLSNTVGTVSLALSGDSQGTNQDSGTSSFFVNLTSNAFLDADFTVFAAIPDMTVINQIMALPQADRTLEPDFGAGAGNLAFSDVPIEANGFQVFITRAFVMEDPLAIARAKAGVAPIMAASAQALTGGAGAAPLASSVVPEPSSFLLAACGILAMNLRVRRRRR
jgi:cyclophilin family peptidyl-prolyl cis-trans isomerase